ncbi:phage tail protein [Photobacterium sp. 1_MG-2023]|uniref:phage tail protein n=1 Tax=Photobacterium sp. 1_MG-2023 TaxID=3062646 RepID=UPI0026E2F303|nr:tail fiber protein [Photobacterium sp. 1_MG-2023]MDO6704982.1 tail fiber protein [Photobacterium sp. 1_MG-2023]
MEPFIGNIQMFAVNFAPRNYAFCDGQVLPVSQNAALFALLGNQFGGNGQTDFKLPDFRGRMPVQPGVAFYSKRPITQAQTGGMEQVTLTEAEMPAHTHGVAVSSQPGDSFRPYLLRQQKATVLAAAAGDTPVYAAPQNLEAMNPEAVGPTGHGTGHENMQPSAVISFCIALTGIFPERD